MKYTFFFPKALDEVQSLYNLATKSVVMIGDGVGTQLAIGL